MPKDDLVFGCLLLAGAASIVACVVTASFLDRRHFPLPQRARHGCLDGLRGYLALSVLVHHFSLWTLATRFGRPWGDTGANLVTELGAGAVGLFFMITGFLFYPTIRGGLSEGGWMKLYVRRAFRILPMVVVSVVAVTAIVIARTGRRGLDAEYALGALNWIAARSEVDLLGYPDTGRINAYVLWSLHYEWLFYVLAIPFCATIMEFRGRLPSWAIPTGLAAVAIVLRAAVARRGLPMYLPLFAAGMLAYELQERPRIRDALRTPIASVGALAALAAGMTLFPTPYSAALPLFAFFFACVAAGNTLFGALASRPSLVLGECSYGIYLLHAIFLSVLFVDGAPLLDRIPTVALPALLPAAAVAVVLATSWTHLAVERPAIAWGAVAVALAERVAPRPGGGRQRAFAPAAERKGAA